MSKVFNIYFKLLTILLCHQILTINAAKTRIVGGIPTTISGKNAFIVSLRWYDGTFFCGGSLVNKNYVVTAAHCVHGVPASEFNVHGGVTYLNEVGEQRSVEKISVPEGYTGLTLDMDVAVLKLSSPMEGPTIATIGLCAHEIYAGYNVIISGWGFLNENEPTPSNQLMTTTIRVTSNTKCKVRYSSLTSNMLCASEPGVKDSCVGDSGGPLVHNGELCGIVSFGAGCGDKDYPGVYTDVNQVKEFINRSMKN